MITVKILSDDQIKDAGSLLYRVYIEQCQWSFSLDNPSGLRVEVYNDQKILIDRFTNSSTWFGAFENNHLIGCARLSGLDENGFLEIEKYQDSEKIHKYLFAVKTTCREITKVAVDPQYSGQGIVKFLFLELFKYCESYHYSVFACTHNVYLKSLFSRIKYPLKVEQAFKYDKTDQMSVNFYLARYDRHEIKTLINTIELEYLDSYVSINSSKILESLDTVAPILPTPVYWHDTNGVVLGINEHCLKAIGTSREIIGKTPYEFYPKEIAEHILKHNEQVMRSGEILSQEEMIEDITTGEPKYFASIKAPLYDGDGLLIGIVGSSVDITAQKEAERLKFENERHKINNERSKAILDEQIKFRQIVGQMIHDIQSPLSSLQTIVSSTTDIPEGARIALRTAAMSIGDIAQQMLRKYNTEDPDSDLLQSILVSALLFEVISEKRYQYKDIAVEFISDFEPEFNEDARFLFIQTEPSSFKRMISNLINNAVEALIDKTGEIKIRLSSQPEWVSISISDNGCGISKEHIKNIHKGISFTYGKPSGHGMGLVQARSTVLRNSGQFYVYSSDEPEMHGTRMVLKFPRIPSPNWITDEICLTKDDTILILDDDQSIHEAWDARLKPILVKNPFMKIEHFSHGDDLLRFIEDFSDTQDLCLLSDYELLKQNQNGLEVIKKAKIKRSTLVTSHYADLQLREQATKMRVKILPKSLVYAVNLKVNKKIKPKSKNVDWVWVDDDKWFMQDLINRYYSDKKIDSYYDPYSLLEDIALYPLETKIILDNYYDNESGELYDISGQDLAIKLINMGYTKVYLLSAESLSNVPNGLTVLLKTDIMNLQNLDKL